MIADSDRPPWARAIRARRLAARLSQGALGEEIGVSQATVADWETGRTQPRDAETITRLATALGVAPADVSPHTFAGSGAAPAASPGVTPGLAEPPNPFLADDLDQQFGSLFAALLRAVQAADPSVSPALVAKWARRIWRQAGGTEEAPPDPEAARQLIADHVHIVAASHPAGGTRRRPAPPK